MRPSKRRVSSFSRVRRRQRLGMRNNAAGMARGHLDRESQHSDERVRLAVHVLRSSLSNDREITHARTAVHEAFNSLLQSHAHDPNRTFFVCFHLLKLGINAAILKRSGIRLIDVRKQKFNGWSLRWLGFTIEDFVRSNSNNEYLGACGFHYRDIVAARRKLGIRNPSGRERPERR